MFSAKHLLFAINTWLVIEIPILGYLGFLEYSATCNAKSDVIFLLSDPDFWCVSLIKCRA